MYEFLVYKYGRSRILCTSGMMQYIVIRICISFYMFFFFQNRLENKDN